LQKTGCGYIAPFKARHRCIDALWESPDMDSSVDSENHVLQCLRFATASRSALTWLTTTRGLPRLANDVDQGRHRT